MVPVMTDSTQQARHRRRANIRLAVLLAAVAVAFYLSVFYFLSR